MASAAGAAGEAGFAVSRQFNLAPAAMHDQIRDDAVLRTDKHWSVYQSNVAELVASSAYQIYQPHTAPEIAKKIDELQTKQFQKLNKAYEEATKPLDDLTKDLTELRETHTLLMERQERFTQEVTDRVGKDGSLSREGVQSKRALDVVKKNLAKTEKKMQGLEEKIAENTKKYMEKTLKLHEKFVQELEGFAGPEEAKKLQEDIRAAMFQGDRFTDKVKTFELRNSQAPLDGEEAGGDGGPSPVWTCKSQITPAPMLKGTFAPELEADLKKRGMHPASQRKEAPGVINFQQTKYSVNNEELFCGLRSGTLAANDPDISASRAKELLTLSLSNFLQRMRSENPDKYEKYRDDIAAGKPIDFQHTSMSLLDLVGDEKKMFKAQLKALEAFQGRQTFELDFGEGPKSVTTNVTIRSFNMSSKAPNWRHGDVGWKKVLGYFVRVFSKKDQEKVNNPAWKQLDEAAEAFITKENSEKARQVQALRGQIRSIRGPEGSNGIGGYTDGNIAKNPYAVQARILAMSYLMGESVHWNCKSGKDRTGAVDIEVKYLLQCWKDTGKFPPIDPTTETPQQRATRRAIALQSGNLEVSFENTGYYGLKDVKDMAYGKLLDAGLSDGNLEMVEYSSHHNEFVLRPHNLHKKGKKEEEEEPVIVERKPLWTNPSWLLTGYSKLAKS